MKVSLGILAHNEGNVISETIKSLADQDIFFGSLNRLASFQIVVVPNGCSDDTAEKARDALTLAGFPDFVHWKVAELEQAGKTNAWNCFVHEFSEKGVDFFILMDGDISFLNRHTLADLIRTLLDNGAAQISMGHSTKDISLKKAPTIYERFLNATSGTYSQDLALAGGMYCIRADAARQVYMPVGISGDDGFLRAMIVTRYFTEQDDTSLIVKADGAGHIFEAYTSIPAIIRHQKRLVIGTYMNSVIYSYLWSNSRPGHHAGQIIESLNCESPDWLPRMLSEKVKASGFWVIPMNILFKRLFNFPRYVTRRQYLKTLILFPAFLVDIYVCLLANSALKRGIGVGYW